MESNLNNIKVSLKANTDNTADGQLTQTGLFSVRKIYLNHKLINVFIKELSNINFVSIIFFNCNFLK